MSHAEQVRPRGIEVEQGYLPYPATKLVIQQYLASSSFPCWLWVILASFYDQDGNVLWSTEIITGQYQFGPDYFSDSDEELSISDDLERREPEQPVSPAVFDYLVPEESEDNTVEYRFPNPLPYPNTARHANRNPHLNVLSYASPRNLAASSNDPPASWDPTRQGPVPGHWQTWYEPDLRRWLHAWVPIY